jgi:hypothetical protein
MGVVAPEHRRVTPNGSEKLQEVLNRLANVRRSGGAYSARCPVHDDHKPSLRVLLTGRGRVWVGCNAGCPRAAILKALDLELEDEHPQVLARMVREPTRRHVYHGEDGQPAAIKLKWSGRGARYSWELPDGTSGLSGLDPGLYRRPAVDAAVRSGAFVWMVEGERDADTLEQGDLVATTGPHGAGTWRPSWTAVLAGAAVVVVADRDRAGIAHARKVAAELIEAGCEVTTLVPPPLAKDVTELFEAGGTIDDLEVLTGDTESNAPKIRMTKEGRPAFAQIPGFWHQLLDPFCLKLINLLDFEQGSGGRPMAGRNNVATLLGWGHEQTDRHLGHLVDHGIVNIEKRGQKRAIYHVNNPSRLPVTKTSGPPQAPLVDRAEVHLTPTSGPPTAPLASSSGLKKFLREEEEVDPVLHCDGVRP